MMSAATADPVVGNDVVAYLEDQEKPLAELAELADAKAISKAWAGGLIEFGRPTYCTVGASSHEKPGGAEGSILIIEGGMEWTGAKGAQHKSYKDIAAETLPVCERYERADLPMVPKTDVKNGHTTYHRPAVKQQEAEAILALRVRLTDKGLSTLSV